VIIVDLNQVMLSNLLMQLGNHTNAQLEENMVRHMILNSIRSYRVKFGAEYGELVIACDNTNIWRKKVYPYYKANRKKNLEKSEMDWKAIFDCLSKIRSELKEYFPYKVIDVESAEADDVIGTLVNKFGSELNTGEKILVLSGDKDFIQLHTYANVSQYDPTRKKWIKNSDPVRYLKEHILKGDSGDGVPNVLSDDDTFVTNKRQKPMTVKRIEEFLKQDPNLYDGKVFKNWQRNKELIDLTNTPDYIKEQVLTQFNEQSGKNRSKLLNYFIANKMKHLIEHLSEF